MIEMTVGTCADCKYRHEIGAVQYCKQGPRDVVTEMGDTCKRWFPSRREVGEKVYRQYLSATAKGFQRMPEEYLEAVKKARNSPTGQWVRCPVCEKAFKKLQSAQTYCSQDCKAAARRERDSHRVPKENGADAAWEERSQRLLLEVKDIVQVASVRYGLKVGTEGM